MGSKARLDRGLATLYLSQTLAITSSAARFQNSLMGIACFVRRLASKRPSLYHADRLLLTYLQ
jgi:hypothetical protein